MDLERLGALIDGEDLSLAGRLIDLQRYQGLVAQIAAIVGQVDTMPNYRPEHAAVAIYGIRQLLEQAGHEFPLRHPTTSAALDSPE